MCWKPRSRRPPTSSAWASSATRSGCSRLEAAPRRPTRRFGPRCDSAWADRVSTSMPDPATRPTTSYEARPEDVHRVLLLYSGGLDTSVMLKWFQEKYEAEVIALTGNLGQPGEDYDVVRGKAQQLGALESLIVDARE